MCKLLIITAITNPVLTKHFMLNMSVPMSISNRHGIGYSAVKSDGSLFAERWHNNHSFMDYNTIMTPEIAEQLAPFSKRLPYNALDINYNSYGDVDFADVKTVTMHTRYATCGKEFVNTHPFIYEDVSLIHNGVIRNASVMNVNKISSCDSEAALQTYITKGVASESSNAKDWIDLLSGSWAFGIIGRDTNNNRILDVVRGSSFLYSMQIEGIGLVFTTDKQDAVTVAKDMNLSITNIELLEMNSMFRYDAITGELIESIDVKPKPTLVADKNTECSPYWMWGDDRYGTSYVPETKASTYSKPVTVNHSDDTLDIFTPNGKIDFRKVKKYCSNSNEPFIDRLEVFDTVHSRDYVSLYECLNEELREYVREMDFMIGFKEARQLLDDLNSAVPDSRFVKQGNLL